MNIPARGNGNGACKSYIYINIVILVSGLVLTNSG